MEDKEMKLKPNDKSSRQKCKIDTLQESDSKSNFGHSIRGKNIWQKAQTTFLRHLAVNYTTELSANNEGYKETKLNIVLRKVGGSTAEEPGHVGQDVHDNEVAADDMTEDCYSQKNSGACGGKMSLRNSQSSTPSIEIVLPKEDDTVTSFFNKSSTDRNTQEISTCENLPTHKDHPVMTKGMHQQKTSTPENINLKQNKKEKYTGGRKKIIHTSVLDDELGERNLSSSASLPGDRRPTKSVCHLTVPDRARSESARTHRRSSRNVAADLQPSSVKVTGESSLKHREEREKSLKSKRCDLLKSAQRCGQFYGAKSHETEISMFSDKTGSEETPVDEGQASQKVSDADHHVAISIHVPPRSTLAPQLKAKSVFSKQRHGSNDSWTQRSQIKSTIPIEKYSTKRKIASPRPRCFGVSTYPECAKSRNTKPESSSHTVKSVLSPKSILNKELCPSATTSTPEAHASMATGDVDPKLCLKSPYPFFRHGDPISPIMNKREKCGSHKSPISVRSEEFVYATVSPILSLACNRDSTISIEVPAEQTTGSTFSLPADHPCSPLLRLGIIPRCAVPLIKTWASGGRQRPQRRPDSFLERFAMGGKDMPGHGGERRHRKISDLR
ncbi:hypothetical protein ElyMa_006090500 [Elysia marginata]|uniref:Uncharacterized protein n=1 Tax=Elysia marginata TaxID=1093978 RepID=A0AAV4GRM0_9GAST|nr:hypothetical protein ElyMa_006090500 [Elysia marginata]